MAQYQSAAGSNCLTATHQIPYSPVSTTYASYTSPYLVSSTSQPAIYMPTLTAASMPCSVRPPPDSGPLPSQNRLASRGYCPSQSQFHGGHHVPLRSPMVVDFSIMETEEQDSVNRESMKSEAIVPPLQGYPKVEDFDNLMSSYVSQLSPKKQDKALIHAKRAANIRAVLIDKKTTSVESAQFRFWVKKMFQLHPTESAVTMSRRKICHEGKPVAIREKLFKILTRAHQKCQHGGRDKTSAQVRRVYSWVPKELISRFVKLCPTCQIRRGASRSSPADDDKENDYGDEDMVDEDDSPIKTRQNSVTAGQDSSEIDMSMQPFRGSSIFNSQNRWMDDFPTPSAAYESLYSTSAALHPGYSFSSNNEMHGYGPGDTKQSSRNASIHVSSESHSHPVSSHNARLKQESQYCLN